MWAIHRLSGVASPANAAFSASELEYQLKSCGAKALFTCIPQLPAALEAASKSGIPRNRVYIISLPKELTAGQDAPRDLKTLDQLIKDGQNAPRLEDLQWKKGQGAKQTAYLCYSSGTSGLPASSDPHPVLRSFD